MMYMIFFHKHSNLMSETYIIKIIMSHRKIGRGVQETQKIISYKSQRKI